MKLFKNMIINNNTWILFSFAFSFMLCIFAPIELFLTNENEFWFSLVDILPGFVLIFLLLLFLLVFSGILVPDSKRRYLFAFICSLYFALYLQGSFLFNGVGLLNGAAIKWADFKLQMIINLLIWMIIFLCIYFFIFKYKEKALSFCKKIIIVIIGIQIITLFVYPLVKNGEEINKNNYFSESKQFDISKKNNTIVFVLDCFDSSIFKSLIETNGVFVNNSFKDFTYYSNVVGGATRTKYAIPFIFTGKTNKEDISYLDYLQKEFSEAELIKTLKQQKINSRIYTIVDYIDSRQTDAFKNIVSSKRKCNNHLGLTTTFFKLIAFKYSPVFAKRFFWIYTNDFNKYSAASIDDYPYELDDVNFYKKLKEKKLNLVNEEVFRFYHLLGPHPPYTMNENGDRVTLGYSSELQQAIGSLKIVQEYLSQLKEIGCYDNSEIYIIADHGSRGIEQNPLFLMKERSVQKKFELNDIALSYDSLSEWITKSLRKEKISFENYNKAGKRRFFYVQAETNKITQLVEFASKGHASDMKGFTETGVVFYGNSKKIDSKYKLGTYLSFKGEGSANRYTVVGFSKNEGYWTWTDGKCSIMQFDKLVGKYNNLILTIEYKTFNGRQPVRIYANDQIVADYDASGAESKTFVLPKEAIGKDNKLLLKFELPGARSPASLGQSDDTREIALAFKSIKISSTEQEFNLKKQLQGYYEFGTLLSFAKNQNATGNKYIIKGFSGVEPTHTWTKGTEAEIRFLLGDIGEDLELMMEYGTFGSRQAVKIYANDQIIADYIAEGEEKKSLVIPKDAVGEDGRLSLRFELPGARSPASLGQSGDTREIALSMKSILLKEKNK